VVSLALRRSSVRGRIKKGEVCPKREPFEFHKNPLAILRGSPIDDEAGDPGAGNLHQPNHINFRSKNLTRTDFSANH